MLISIGNLQLILDKTDSLRYLRIIESSTEVKPPELLFRFISFEYIRLPIQIFKNISDKRWINN